MRGGAATRPHPRPTRSSGSRGPRARRADGDAFVAPPALASVPSASPFSFWTRTALAGDQLLAHRGLAALARAEALEQPLGPYALQAAIAGCHTRARTAGETDWTRIVALYDALVELTKSPVVELNRAVAVSMAFGPAAGLELVDTLVDVPALESYHLLPSVRGDLLAKLGRDEEARGECARAAALTRNARERELLLSRARACEACEACETRRDPKGSS